MFSSWRVDKLARFWTRNIVWVLFKSSSKAFSIRAGVILAVWLT
jgi:hypothetical protein